MNDPMHPAGPPPEWSRDTLFQNGEVNWPFWQRLKTAWLIAVGGTVRIRGVCHTENEMGRTEGFVELTVTKRWPWEGQGSETLGAS